MDILKTMNDKKKNVESCLDMQPMQTTTTCNVCIFFAKFGNMFLKGKQFKDMIGNPFNVRSYTFNNTNMYIIFYNKKEILDKILNHNIFHYNFQKDIFNLINWKLYLETNQLFSWHVVFPSHGHFILLFIFSCFLWIEDFLISTCFLIVVIPLTLKYLINHFLVFVHISKMNELIAFLYPKKRYLNTNNINKNQS